MPRIDKTTTKASVQMPTTVEMPKGLSKAGEIFWRFLQDKEQAVGNEPRDHIRSKLIQTFRNDLTSRKPAINRFMETDHGFIQWLFPLETVGVNPYAPVLQKKDYKLLKEVDDCKSKMTEHFLLFTEFMGVEYDKSKGTFQKVNAEQWNSWIEHSHNNLRISRVLSSMKDFGLEQVAKDFLEFLQKESERLEDEVVSDQPFRQFAGVTRSSCQNYWAKCL